MERGRNAAAFAPCSATPLTVNGKLPLLLSVTVCAALVVFNDCEAKLRLDDEAPNCAAAPTPERVMVVGLVGALLVSESVALWVPPIVGAKRTPIEQLLPDATAAHTFA